MGIDVKNRIPEAVLAGAKAKPLEPVCMSFSLSIGNPIFISRVKDFSSPVVRSSTYSPMLRLSKAKETKAQNESIKQALLQDVCKVKVNPISITI
jgi:hypothetical protein